MDTAKGALHVSDKVGAIMWIVHPIIISREPNWIYYCNACDLHLLEYEVKESSYGTYAHSALVWF